MTWLDLLTITTILGFIIAGVLWWFGMFDGPAMEDVSCDCGKRMVRRVLTLDAMDARAVKRLLSCDCPGCRCLHSLRRSTRATLEAARLARCGTGLPAGHCGGRASSPGSAPSDSQLTPLNPDMFTGGAPSLPAATLDPKEEDADVPDLR